MKSPDQSNCYSSARKTALVVEGGGMRSVFSSGVLNAFAQEGFDPFDLYIGVSAGACNLASHLAEQYTRNFDIIERWSTTSNAISPWRFLKGGHYIDLDWLWDITISQYRLDLQKICGKDNKEFLIVATSRSTGKPLYLKPTPQNLEHFLKVSSALPFFYRNPLDVDGEPATDGGVADAIPVIEAWRRGANRIVVVRSRKLNYQKNPGFGDKVMAWFLRQQPAFAEAIKTRADRYKEAVRFIRSPPDGVEVVEILPPEEFTTGRTTTDIRTLRKDYKVGQQAGFAAVRSSVFQ